MKMKAYKNISEYISNFPPDTQVILEEIRSKIRKVMPSAEEAISYGIPVFKLEGKNAIFMAGYKSHVSIYPAPRSEPTFKKEMEKYKGGKGTVQFPLDKPIPYELISRIARFRLADTTARLKVKKTKAAPKKARKRRTGPS